MKIYTKTGDDGTTGLLGNMRVRKDAARIEAYGAVDELNSAVGLIVAHLPAAAQKARAWLDAVQSDLFSVGTKLATPPRDRRTYANVPAARVEALEGQIDQLEKELPPLKNFILPQGMPCAAFAHAARSIARRAERRTVALSAEESVDSVVIVYLNRLSDFLFVLARWINQRESGTETAWINPLGASAAPGGAGAAPDRLSATLAKIEADKEKRKTLFEKASSDLEKKKREAEQAFRQSVDQIKKDGGKVEKPLRDVDLD